MRLLRSARNDTTYAFLYLMRLLQCVHNDTAGFFLHSIHITLGQTCILQHKKAGDLFLFLLCGNQEFATVLTDENIVAALDG